MGKSVSHLSHNLLNVFVISNLYSALPYYVGPVYFIEAYPLLFGHLARELSPKQLTVNFVNSSLRR